MKNTHILSLLILASGLIACQQNQYGLSPSALQEYVATVDAKATVQALNQHRKTIPVTKQLHTKKTDVNNTLYNQQGQLVFLGSSLNQEQLVRLNPDGSTTVVEDFLSDPQGNYIGFTPRHIYHINKATGQTVKIVRPEVSESITWQQMPMGLLAR